MVGRVSNSGHTDGSPFLDGTIQGSRTSHFEENSSLMPQDDNCFRVVLRNWFMKVGGPAQCKEGSHLLHAAVHTHDEARLANPILDLGLLRLY